jgi:fatty-acyl-CoA synthase
MIFLLYLGEVIKNMEKLLDVTLGTALRERVLKSADREFIIFPDRNLRYTFSDIDKKVDLLAKGLLAADFKRGDHIGIWANNVPEWPIIFYAAARLGIVVVPINVNCKHQEIAYILNQSDIKSLFIIGKFRDVDFADMLYQLIPELKAPQSGSLKSEMFPYLKMIVALDTTPRQGMYILEDLIQMGNQNDNEELKKMESEVGSNDTICILYTSGTTGTPKGVMLTHKNVINTNYNINRLWLLNENDIVLNPLPFFHVFALTGCIIESVVHGFKYVVIEIFDARKCLEIIQKEECSWIYGVPTMYMAMLNHPQFCTYSMKSVGYCCISAAFCPLDLMKTVMIKMCKKGLYLAYGLTEAIPVTDVVIKDPSDPMIRTVGVPLPGVEVSIRNSNNLDCPVNTEGEICVKGFNVMQGYYKMEEATGEAIDKDGWLHTGDLGHLLPNGYLVIDGRIKELIIRGGENIYPKEVENLLLTMPGIQDVQIAGIPSKKYGEEVGAFVILKPEVSISERDVIDFCKERISFYKIPTYVFFVNHFPLSAVGKIMKYKLSEFGFKEVCKKGTAT